MRVDFKMSGYRAIRTSAGVTAELHVLTEAIAAECNASSNTDGGYVANVSKGRSRSRGSVVTANAAAIEDNARNNTIIRAVGGSR
jgi:hypothetical protein